MRKGKAVINQGYQGSTDNISNAQIKAITENGTTFNGSASTININLDDLNQSNDSLDSNKKGRPTWSNSLEFLMSCISMSVGLGNIWRFPFTAYENGGGAFLIPYIIVLLLIGKPIYYLEMILGQFTSRSSIKIWDVCPILRGVGAGQIIATTCVVTYYCSLIALTLRYFFASFAAELPWSKCRPEWGSNCVDSKPSDGYIASHSNGTRSISSSEFYFTRVVLKEKHQIHDGIGLPDWQLSLWLLLAWAIVFLVIIRGVKSSGKAAYFLAIFPYVVMITLLIRAVTLDGAIDGILYFFKPQWSQLLNPKIWKEAITQCCASLGVGYGTMIMFSSYNKFNHNINRDAVIVTSLDTFTSLLAGATIFGILGNLAHNLNIDSIDEVVRSGTGLAFISYPDAISKFDVVPQLFAVLFFFMLLTLGIGSAVALQSTIITVIVDQFPKIKYWKVALGGCIAGFLAGLIYITPGGQWMLSLVDHFGGTFLIFALAIVQVIGIFWIYGIENICNDVKFMIGHHVTLYWRLCWAFITPCLLIIIFIYYMATLKTPTYSGWEYPDSAIIAGYILLAIGVLQVPLWIVWYFSTDINLTWSEHIKVSFKHNDEWGPKSTTDYKAWLQYRADANKRRIDYINENNQSFLQQKLYILLGKYR